MRSSHVKYFELVYLSLALNPSVYFLKTKYNAAIIRIKCDRTVPMAAIHSIFGILHNRGLL
jgi:hypothetical protein